MIFVTAISYGRGIRSSVAEGVREVERKGGVCVAAWRWGDPNNVGHRIELKSVLED